MSCKSLEDLRDSYKNSRQSKNGMHDLNGATFKKFAANLKNRGNTIVLNKKSNEKNEELERINQIYGLIDSKINYSLNKKKRWEVNKQIKCEMEEFNSNDFDIRLYETIDVNNSRDLISFHRSKGN